MNLAGARRSHVPPRPPAPQAERRELALVPNSLALIGAKVAAMALGFVFWLAAARLFARTEVGVAAAAVSAMMLCTQLALLGVGSAVVAEMPAHRERPWELLTSAARITAVASLAAGLGFLTVAAVALDDLGVVVDSPAFALLFIGATLFGTFGVLLDQVATALRRGDLNVVRGVVFGVTTLGVLLALVWAGAGRSAQAAFTPWVIAGALTCAIGLVQLRRALPARNRAGRLDRDGTRALVRVGLPNHALTLAERLPGLALPLVVTELLSARANAAWYIAWMMAWVLYIVPIQVGMTIFAEVAADPSSLGAALRRGMTTSLAVGAAGIVVVLAGAEPVLSLLSSAYADDGAAAVRILVLGVLPMTVTLAYFAACRALRRLPEALLVGWAGALLSLAAAGAAAAWADDAGDLEGIAAAWLAVQTGVGFWAGARLVRLRREVRDPGH